ncbi:MAG: hypothetical protein R3E66_17620 [bacterium]
MAYLTQLALLPLTLYAIYWKLAPVLTPFRFWWEAEYAEIPGLFVMTFAMGMLLTSIAVLSVTGVLNLLFLKAGALDELRDEKRLLWIPWVAAGVEVTAFVLAAGLAGLLN